MTLYTHIYGITFDGEVVHIFYLFHYLLFSLIYFGYFFPIWRNNTRKRFGLHIIMYNYLFIVLSLTVVPLAISWDFHRFNVTFIQEINFIPFRDMMHGYAYAKREALLNVMMMIPFGFLLPLLTNKRWFATIVATFLLSITIETTQLFTILFQMDKQRVVDVTDMITNTIGGMCGYFIFYFLKKSKIKNPL